MRWPSPSPARHAGACHPVRSCPARPGPGPDISGRPGLPEAKCAEPPAHPGADYRERKRERRCMPEAGYAGLIVLIDGFIAQTWVIPGTRTSIEAWPDPDLKLCSRSLPRPEGAGLAHRHGMPAVRRRRPASGRRQSIHGASLDEPLPAVVPHANEDPRPAPASPSLAASQSSLRQAVKPCSLIDVSWLADVFIAGPRHAGRTTRYVRPEQHDYLPWTRSPQAGPTGAREWRK